MNATQPVARDATPEGTRDPSRLGPTLYRDWDIHVTQRFLLLPGESFAVADVQEVSVGRAPCAPFGVTAALLSAVAMSALAVCVVAGAVNVGVVAAIATAALGTAAAVTWQARPHELWIRYRGREIFVFRCQDEVRFGKVARALQRARQQK
jgi:Family of unknown function (DUF6232)